MKVGIIGIGMLGEAVGARLIEKGHKICAYNRTRKATANLEKMGAIIADAPQDVSLACDFIIICVTDAVAVRNVVFGDKGITCKAHGNLIVGDMSTIGPADSKEIATRLDSEFDIRMLGIPVMGGPDAARSGSLIVIADGNKDAYEKINDVLCDISQTIHHVGDNGTAHTIKLAMNLQISSLALALAEGIELVRSANVSPENFLAVLNSTYFGTGMSKKKSIQDDTWTVHSNISIT